MGGTRSSGFLLDTVGTDIPPNFRGEVEAIYIITVICKAWSWMLLRGECQTLGVRKREGGDHARLIGAELDVTLRQLNESDSTVKEWMWYALACATFVNAHSPVSDCFSTPTNWRCHRSGALNQPSLVMTTLPR